MCSAAWPRYRVLRSFDIGQYNLEISNAELSDDSIYECQATEAALRSRRAKLSVLGKRSSESYFVRVSMCVRERENFEKQFYMLLLQRMYFIP